MNPRSLASNNDNTGCSWRVRLLCCPLVSRSRIAGLLEDIEKNKRITFSDAELEELFDVVEDDELLLGCLIDFSLSIKRHRESETDARNNAGLTVGSPISLSEKPRPTLF